MLVIHTTRNTSNLAHRITDGLESETLKQRHWLLLRASNPPISSPLLVVAERLFFSTPTRALWGTGGVQLAAGPWSPSPPPTPEPSPPVPDPFPGAAPDPVAASCSAAPVSLLCDPTTGDLVRGRSLQKLTFVAAKFCNSRGASEMEIIIIISLVVLLALGALFVIPKSQNRGKAKETNSGADGMTSRSYTKEEISKHNTRKDCWIIIKDKVYDVTPYVEEHPGGDAILNNAGGDSTEGFFGPQHGTRVFDIIEDFCIGQLKAS